MSRAVRVLASFLWRLVTRRAGPAARRAARPAGPLRARLRPVIGKHVAMAGRPVSPGIPIPRHLGGLMVAMAVAAVVLATQHAGASEPGFSTGATVASVYPLRTAHQTRGQADLGGRGASEHAGPQRGSAAAKQAAAGGQPQAAQPPKRPAAPSPPENQLLPAAVAGGQQSISVTSDRMNNAKVIVDQARAMHLGNRAAVVAVATAMQESKLENLDYGDEDSLGLFQQRPSAGWGTPGQITNPSYAAGAFLDALYQYERSNSAWATQPLWMAAQGVQDSAFPTAYGQWEQQAANIVWRLDRLVPLRPPAGPSP